MSERIRDFPTGWGNGVENEVTSPSTQDIISTETIIG